MFRFAILVLAGIGLGAILFGGGASASAGIGFLSLIPLFFLFKILVIGAFFGVFARRRFGSFTRNDDPEIAWEWPGDRWLRPRREPKAKDESTETDRFEEWHRMAHAKEEVASWADEPE